MRWLLLVALIGAGACGARTDLSLEGVDPPVDAGRPGEDSGPDAGSGECAMLTPIGAPVPVFDEPTVNYESPRVIARSGGFDILGFRSGSAEIAYVARRARIEEGVVLEASLTVVGPDARSSGAIAVRGDRLALCYGGRDLEGPSRFTVLAGEDYRPVVISTLGRTGGDWCTNLVASGDLWVAVYNDRRGPGSLGLIEVDDEGRVVSGPMNFEANGASLSALGGGYALATLVDSEVRVRFPDGATATRSAALYLDLLQITPSPTEPRAVELAWLTRGGEAEVVRLSPDGRASRELPLMFRENWRGGPVLANHAGQVIVARGDPDQVTLWVRRPDGALGEALTLEISIDGEPALASDGETLLMVWSERIESELRGPRVMAWAFRCR